MYNIAIDTHVNTRSHPHAHAHAHAHSLAITILSFENLSENAVLSGRLIFSNDVWNVRTSGDLDHLSHHSLQLCRFLLTMHIRCRSFHQIFCMNFYIKNPCNFTKFDLIIIPVEIIHHWHLDASDVLCCPISASTSLPQTLDLASIIFVDVKQSHSQRVWERLVPVYFPVAQWLACQTSEESVTGSIPTHRAFYWEDRPAQPRTVCMYT